jgi:hypothetical protein
MHDEVSNRLGSCTVTTRIGKPNPSKDRRRGRYCKGQTVTDCGGKVRIVTDFGGEQKNRTDKRRDLTEKDGNGI